MRSLLTDTPASPPKIEAAGTGLSLSTAYTLRHSNWLVMTVTVEDLGKFKNCYIELHNIPLVRLQQLHLLSPLAAIQLWYMYVSGYFAFIRRS